MSTNETIVEPVENDLDTFAAELFGRKEAAPVETTTEVEETEDEESDAQTEDTHVDEEDTLAPDNDDEIEEEDEPVEAPKPKKNRLQERINQLLEKERIAVEKERAALAERDAALAEVAALKNTPSEPKPEKERPSGAPDPNAKNEDGTDKYPLGDFDPNYQRDFIKFTLDEERRIRDEQEQVERANRERAEAAAQLQNSWNEKLVTAQERYPDFQDKGQQMLGTFESIDPAYGEYLTNTIMEMEYGPDVFYYLASNVDEAKKIVDSGARKATIALGRLEAKFAAANEEKEKTRPRVSQAPPPPQHLNKGAAPVVAKDLSDLDVFSAELFRKERK